MSILQIPALEKIKQRLELLKNAVHITSHVINREVNIVDIMRTCQDNAGLLNARQKYNLNGKIHLSKQRIKEWVEHWGVGNVYVAFSGGKDSTVLLHLVRSLFPDVKAVFVDTGLEYPEIREFVKTIDNVEWIRPEMPFKNVLERYGFPVISKKVSMLVRRILEMMENPSEKNRKTRTLYMTGVNSKGEKSSAFKLPKKWIRLLNAPFKISDKCCDVIKKKPMMRYEREYKSHPFTGEMAADSQQRRGTYLRNGCNIYTSKNPKSSPLAVWTDADIWEYIKRFNVPYSTIYDMGYSRTGCAFCIFGAHLEKPCNRFQRMKKTHPKLWGYCLDKLGLREVLEFLGIPYN